MRDSAIVITLYVLLCLAAAPQTALAQEPTTSDPQLRQVSSQPPATATPSGAQTTVPAKPRPDDALDNPVLKQAEEEDIITDIESHVMFKYNHDEYDGGASGERVRIDWLQAFGPANRMAAGIELPLIHFNGSNGEPSGSGLGDIKLEFRCMLGKGFCHARAAGYLDWDTYYDFNASEYAQALKVGLEFQLDHKEKWGLSPYFQFPLNHLFRITEIKNSVGIDLSYNF